MFNLKVIVFCLFWSFSNLVIFHFGLLLTQLGRISKNIKKKFYLKHFFMEADLGGVSALYGQRSVAVDWTKWYTTMFNPNI